MSELNPFENFLASESESQRIAALDAASHVPIDGYTAHQMWNVIFNLPSRTEKSRIAHNLRVSKKPDSNWALVSTFFHDTEQDVIGNSINALTLSSNRALGHRILRFFESLERPQRILYCLARYAEEAVDHRLTKFLSPNLASDLSDAFLARSFNALYRLGTVDRFAVEIAKDLVASHIDATNMDRKAAVSAVLYLCFAGNVDDLEKLKNVTERIAIPELRRLLNWGFSTVEQYSSDDFGKESAVKFFEHAFHEKEPNFIGFGCLKKEFVSEAFTVALSKLDASQWQKATETTLALGSLECTEILAKSAKFGLLNALTSNSQNILDIWKKFAPLSCAEFTKVVQDTKYYSQLHAENPELLFMVLSPENFSGKSGWLDLLKNSKEDFSSRLNVLLAFLVSLEKIPVKETKEHCKNFIVLLGELQKAADENQKAQLRDSILALLIGGNFENSFAENIFKQLTPTMDSWAIRALSFDADHNTMSAYTKDVIEETKNSVSALPTMKMSMEDFLPRYIGLIQATINCVTNGQTFPDDFFETAHKNAVQLHSVLSAISETAQTESQTTKGEETDDDAGDSGDWAGHVAQDRPLLRWDAILQVLGRKSLSEQEINEYESVLVEAMRVAPHVEKRWIVRALVRLGTDDCIKAVLYQAFQHVDADFVTHTIRELLPSKHPRAQQALIRCVGRNAVSDELKLTILEEISLNNPDEILQELRTLEILRLPQHIDEAIKDALGRVGALVQGDAKDVSSQTEVSTADVDNIMRSMLPEIETLSVDTRSALRTAEMILIQSKDWGAEAVDLSPIVNMHFKAVELTMREVFEPFTDAIIRKGILSRKLDLLGYARPIPEKMQVFEDYLASLPVIKTIPYFSKFKLRKMLRAICLYRPGKRFTLDGPKAFALFFLVASRAKCAHGLDHILSLDFKSDNDLFEFIKLVHSLQDSRNRAVHEGLTWEAKDEIEAMRKQAYKIIEQSIKQANFLQKTYGNASASGQSSRTGG